MTSTLTKEHLQTLPVEALVELAQGDSRTQQMMALEMLVKRHQKSVYAAFYQLAPERSDLADLTQEALLRMCRSIKSLKNPKTFKYWLNRIITNLFYDELRKASRRLQPISLDDPIFDEDKQSGQASASKDVPDESALPTQLALNAELDQKIHDAIATLPEQFRLTVVLREIQGLSYEEIAELTEVNLGTVKSRLARARLKLQEILSPYLNETKPQ